MLRMQARSIAAVVALYLARCQVEGKSSQTVRAYRETLARFVRSLPAPGLAIMAGAQPERSRGTLFQRLGRRAGVHANPHRFQQTFATWAIENHARELDVQYLLEHSTSAMVRRTRRSMTPPRRPPRMRPSAQRRGCSGRRLAGPTAWVASPGGMLTRGWVDRPDQLNAAIPCAFPAGSLQLPCSLPAGTLQIPRDTFLLGALHHEPAYDHGATSERARVLGTAQRNRSRRGAVAPRPPRSGWRSRHDRPTGTTAPAQRSRIADTTSVGPTPCVSFGVRHPALRGRTGAVAARVPWWRSRRPALPLKRRRRLVGPRATDRCAAEER